MCVYVDTNWSNGHDLHNNFKWRGRRLKVAPFERRLRIENVVQDADYFNGWTPKDTPVKSCVDQRTI